MPDTYTSQFSGEEIDSALRAAQIISGADTPAALRKKLEIRGDTIPVSATDPTPVSEALTASGGGVNPNLLDNWYFGRPVIQRNGYYIPQGAIIYSDSSLSESSKIGPAAYACTVVEKTSTYVKVQDAKASSSYYYAAVNAAVPGYCTVGYTVDRWRLGFDSGSSSLQLTNDGVIYNAGSIGGYENFSQPYPKESCIVGQLYTISFLVDNFQNVNQVFNTKTGSNFDITENLISYTFSYNSTPDANPDIGIQFKKGTSTLIKAAKLELGDTQTLAHKEGDKWVLNEIPDFGEQLRRCQRYALKIEGGKAYGWTYNTNTINVFIPTPVTMRAVPSLVLDTKHTGSVNTVNGDVAITSIGGVTATSNGVSVDLNNSNSAFTIGTPVVWFGFEGHLTCDL